MPISRAAFLRRFRRKVLFRRTCRAAEPRFKWRPLAAPESSLLWIGVCSMLLSTAFSVKTSVRNRLERLHLVPPRDVRGKQSLPTSRRTRSQFGPKSRSGATGSRPSVTTFGPPKTKRTLPTLRTRSSSRTGKPEIGKPQWRSLRGSLSEDQQAETLAVIREFV